MSDADARSNHNKNNFNAKYSPAKNKPMDKRKTPQEWQQILDPERYEVCINHGTEPPFSGKYNKYSQQGRYLCVCCKSELFASDAKFDSGSGWPSFWRSSQDDNIEYVSDSSYGMVRTEVNCNRCGAHLGHVFDDGPAPTNLRYCINSLSLLHENDTN